MEERPLCVNFKRVMQQQQQNQRHLVFVYGTLKRNEPNHEKYMKNSPRAVNNLLVGTAELVTKLPLVVASRHNVSSKPIILLVCNHMNTKHEFAS